MQIVHSDLYQRFKDADTREARVCVACDAVQDNPLIIDFYFSHRFQLFNRYILKPKFSIVDYWDRLEWQAHGSAYNHRLYWCDGAPENKIKILSQDQQTHFA